MKKNTKEILMTKGEELISKKGYYDTKVEDITKESGVAKGTFYIYFESKEELFMEMINKKGEIHGATVKKIEEQDIEFKDKIMSLTEAFIKLMVENLGFFRSFFKISQLDNGSIGEKIKKMMIKNHYLMNENLSRIFLKAVNTGEINIKYKDMTKELAIMYDTMRSEYIVRRLLDITYSKGDKEIECPVRCNKLDAIDVSAEDIDIRKEAEFITNIFLCGVN